MDPTEGGTKMWDNTNSETCLRPLRRPNLENAPRTENQMQEPSSRSNRSSADQPDSKSQTQETISSPAEQPNFASSANMSSTENHSQATAATVKDGSKSKLSAEAQEWFPSNYVGVRSTPTVSSVQARLLQHKKNRNQAEDRSNGTQNESFAKEKVDRDIERLRHMIDNLTADPGQFDMLVQLFVESVRPYYNNIEVLSLLAEILLSHAIREKNFTYTSARLCSLVEQDCPVFRSELHLKCCKALDEKVNLQGLTLFLAELYLQLHYENLYGRCLLDALQGLIDCGSDVDIKCACQALKLTGSSLEMYNVEGLNEIFTKLQSLRSTLSPSVANLLNSVVRLRNERWGVSDDSVENNVHNASDPNVLWTGEDGTVFYGPIDSLDFSIDEQLFAANLDDDELSDPDGLCDPEPEMDEEIQAAFKEFLKLSKK